MQLKNYLTAVLAAFLFLAGESVAGDLKIIYVNGVNTKKMDAMLSAQELALAYSRQRSAGTPLATDVVWTNYYNETNLLIGDIGEVAVQIALETEASRQADAQLRWQKSLASVGIGAPLSERTAEGLRRDYLEAWRKRLIFAYVSGFKRAEFFKLPKIATVISGLKAHLVENLSGDSRIVVVAHSQGNLFVEEAWSQLSNSEKSRIRVVNVANAASTSASGKYITLKGDHVIELASILARIIAAGSTAPALPTTPNVDGYFADPDNLYSSLFGICGAFSVSCDDWLAHYFVETYLNPQILLSRTQLEPVSRQIVRLVVESISELTSPRQWDAVADFSFAKNPTGPWEYRYDSPTQPARRMLAAKTNCSDLHMDCWKVDVNAIDLPFVAINNSGATILQRSIQVPTGMLVLHPGFTSPAGLDWRPIVSWTAPATGTYAITGKFQIVDFTPTGVRVILKEDATSLIDESLNGFNSVRPFALTRTLNAGQVISFTVDPSGSYGNDSTGLVITIAQQVPLLNPANGHRYEVIDCGTWTQCRDASASKGGKLVTVRSQAENDWLIANILPLINSTRNVWIGLRRVAPGGAFAWESGEPFTYTRWLSGQPNNGSGIENCVNTIRDVTFGGYWADSFCDASPITQAIVEYTN